MKIFDLINTPLDGSHLLEAGAGTGKTFSLSFLYLRLLLEKQLRVEEIVVATFTNAATAELKQRIYARLFEAETALLALTKQKQSPDKTTFNNDDPLLVLLNNLRNTISDEDLHKRLRLAQAQFDRAHIHSINGFALQLLHEHAVTLGQTIPEDILNDDNELIKSCYLDLAHNDFKDFGEHADNIGKVVATMSSAELFSLLTSMHQNYQALKNAEHDFPDVSTAVEKFDTAATFIKNNVENRDCAIEGIISAIDAGYLSKSSYKLDKVKTLKQKLYNDSYFQVGNIKEFELFTSQKLHSSLIKKGKDAGISFDNEIFSAFDTLKNQASVVEQGKNIEFYYCLMRLLDVIRERLDAEKADAMAMTHDDVVNIVSEGAEKLHLPLKAALLDEAQDTNRAQLTLFKKLFLERGHICFFVGDPKQAIYGFRGGDVYTYLAIRKGVEHTHRLPKNYRSTQALNESINHIFAHNPFASANIDYHPIEWEKDNSLSDFAEKSLSIVSSPSKTVSDITQTAANRIIALLEEGHQITKNGQKRPLQSGDIAVLVRGKTQAEHIKNALAERGLAASYTGKNSIFSSDEALLMHSLLLAISGGQIRHVKSLMLTALFEYTPDDILNDDIVTLLRHKLQNYNNTYGQRGFAAMFYSLMHDFNVGGRLLQRSDGKRRLSNWIQLFEILQQALQNQSLTLLGLNDWLLHNIHSHQKDETQFRLEDKNAVSIMTMHSSKGLEFDVVCLPYFHYQPSQRGGSNDNVIVSHSEQLACLERLKIKKISDICEREKLAEDIRLAYVALTRATYQNIIIEQPNTGANASRDNSLWARLIKSHETDITAQHFCEVCIDNNQETKLFHAHEESDVEISTLPTRLQPKWLMTSFSGLQQRMNHHHDSGTDSTPTLPKTNNQHKIVDSKASALMNFPAGAKAGVVLHTIYEHYMLTRSCDNDFINMIAEELKLSKLSFESDITTLAPELAGAIADTAKVALSPHTFCLNDIDTSQQSIEMAFFLHLNSKQRQYIYQHFGQSIENNIDGFLHGFIDYCFCYEDKFYILDYKSNKLGETTEEYNQSMIQQAMNEHRYDLQALIYTVALCRHLGIKSKDEYEKRIGGYYYLFIRGMDDKFQPHAPKQIKSSTTGIYFNNQSWKTVSLII
ncbi:MAG: UvrD-helicase domain-containing protein [Gammaproteobacteria bacterium]|nr:UvrD-helicase domain-containing protein [Gammaproteobacteria bacterium]